MKLNPMLAWSPGCIRREDAAWSSGLGRWPCNPEVSGPSPPPCHRLDLFSVVPSSNNPQLRFVYSQLQICLLPVGIFNHVIFILNCFVSYVSVACLQTSHLKAKRMTTINKIYIFYILHSIAFSVGYAEDLWCGF